ncbi:MAG: hypothetical protein AAGA54_02340 [Myxococcota bacterium]
MLDTGERALLDEFRDARGPTEEAEARMLAGLRARLEADALADGAPTHEHPAVTAAPQLHRPPTASSRTTFVAIAAFAAGVALTLAVGRDASDGPEPASERPTSLVQATDTAAPPATTPHPETVAPTRPGSAPQAPAPAVEDGAGPVDPEPAPSRSRSADDDAPEETTAMAERAGAQQGRGDEQDEDPGNDRLAAATTARDPRSAALGPRGTAAHPPAKAGTTWSTAPAGVPSSGGTFGRSFGPVEVGPSVGFGGSQAQSTPTPSGTPDSNPPDTEPASPSSGPEEPAGDDGPSPEPEPEPDDEEPEPEPDDEEPEPDDEGDPDEHPELVCNETHQACIESALYYCKANPEACPHYMEFCDLDFEVCLGHDPIGPIDEPYQEPQCEEAFEHCMLEYDMLCGPGFEDGATPEECDMFHWSCESMYSECMGEEPPPPPDEW